MPVPPATVNVPLELSKPATDATVRLPPERSWLAPFTVVLSVPANAVRLIVLPLSVALSISTNGSTPSTGIVVVIPSALIPLSL